MGRIRSPKRRVRDDDFVVGLSSDHGRIVCLLAEAIQGFPADILNSEFRGRRSIWWSWTVTSDAPRIVNNVASWKSFFVAGAIWWSWIMTPDAPRIVLDVSCEARISHQSHFSWQAKCMRFIFRGRHTIWWSWRMTPDAPRIVLDVSFEIMIIKVIFRGRGDIWWTWRMSLVAPRIVDVSCVVD